MNEITKRLHDKALDSFKPVIEMMAEEGCSEAQIVKAYQNHLKQKTNHFYNKQKDLVGFKDCFSVSDLKKADSKAEALFYRIMLNSGIKFTFQHNIGPYRADYLVMGFLVIEIDGPQHDVDHDKRRDKYLRSMGYEIIRVPTWVLMSCPDAVIDEIKGAVKVRRVK